MVKRADSAEVEAREEEPWTEVLEVAGAERAEDRVSEERTGRGYSYES
jgi:hypothetical protein